jgi:hypothetical protein
MTETTWRLLKCSKGGSQWSETETALILGNALPGDQCGFSGCKCRGKGKIILAKKSATREEASEWFKRS